MAVPYHTHTFEIPVATKTETGEVSISNKVLVPSSVGTAAVADTGDFATASQGALADTAVQPADLATVATSGAYSDLTGLPTLGTAAAEDTTAFATAAQGVTADSALQPGDIGTDVQAYSANLDTLAAVTPGAAGTSILALSLSSDVRNILDVPTYVATRTALKALDTAKDVVAILMESGREGIFNWKTGDYSTEIAADTLEGVYVKATAIAASSGAWVREYVGKPALPWFGADKTGVSDASGSLASAVGIYPHLIIPEGEYLIDQDVTIPAGVTVEFDRGAILNFGTGVVPTWNGGIIAGPYQHIFKGDLSGLDGIPQIDFCTPYWFGALGDNTQDDLPYILKAHAFGHCFVPKPSSKFMITDSLALTISDRNFWGNGDAWFRLVSVPTGAGEVLAIHGDEPTISGDLASVTYVENINVWGVKIECDSTSYENNNGVGVSFARGCRIFDFELVNIGRKAATCQYFCDDVRIFDFVCNASNMEAAGTASAVTIEGMFSGFNFANGVAAWDAEGADMNNVVIENWTIDFVDGAEGGATLSNVGKSCRIGNGVIKSMSGRVATMARKAKGKIHDIDVLSNISRAIVFTESTATGVVTDISVPQTTSESAISSAGPTLIRNISFDHTSATAAAIALTGATELEGIEVLGCANADMITMSSAADRASIRKSKLIATVGCTRILTSSGDDTVVDDNSITLHSATTTGLRFDAVRPRATRNKLYGGVTQQILCTTNVTDPVITENQSDLGTATILFQGSSLYSSHTVGNTGFNSSANNLRLGARSLWQDSTADRDLRVTTSTPLRTTDTDGIVVGTQT